jgi:DNA-directed RNA polymerase sigma subunit (sigma70/sigma32)
LIQRKVITSRFGLAKGTSPRTLKEIAVSMGISRERVRQIEGRALRQMRRLAETLQVDPPEDD